MQHSVRISDADLVAEYLTSQRRRGLQASTVEWKQEILTAWRAWLRPRRLADATADDVDRFLDERGEVRGELCSRTRYHWISQLHVFYAHAMRMDHIERDPTMKVDRPKLPPLFPRPISDEHLVRAMAATKVAAPDLHAWLLLMAYAGLRCCEIARMDRADLLETNTTPVLVVHGKGNKDRIVPAHPVALAALERMGFPRTGAMFTRPRGGRWPATKVSSRTNGFLRELGIDETAHQLRHWFGTRLYAETRDLRLVQELMGHTDPKTTSHYTMWASDEAHGAVIRLDVERSQRRPTLQLPTDLVDLDPDGDDDDGQVAAGR